jgi:hypothetical protein
VLGAVAVGTLVSSAALLAPHRALAQDSARPCTEIENDTERLACYDRALRPARAPAPAAAPTSAAAPQAPLAQAPAPAAPAAAAPAPAPAAAAPAVVAGAAVASGAATPPPTAAAPATAAAAPAPAQSSPPEIMPIVVVNVRQLAGRNDKVFTTDLGAVWVQTDNVRVTYPEPPFEAQIKAGMMGSFFFTVDDRHRSVRVKRSP